MKDIFLIPEKEIDMCSKACIGAIPLLVFCTLLATIISGCGEYGGTAALSSSEKTVLAWEAPTTFNDGTSRIAPDELTGYRIYIYTDANLTARYADYLVSGPNPPTSINLIDLNNTVFADEISRGTSHIYYLAVTAIVSVNGMEIESAPSNSMSYTYP